MRTDGHVVNVNTIGFGMLVLLAMLTPLVGGCNGVTGDLAAKTTYETIIASQGNIASAALTGGVPTDPDTLAADLASRDATLSDWYAAATTNEFDYTWGVDGKAIKVTQTAYDLLETMHLHASEYNRRAATATLDDNQTRWVLVNKYIVLIRDLSKAQEASVAVADTTATKARGGLITFSLADLPGRLAAAGGVQKTSPWSWAIGQQRAAKDIDTDALADAAIEALQTGLDALWATWVANSGVAITATEDWITNVVEALQAEDTAEAKRLILEALADADLNDQAVLVLTTVIELANENAAEQAELESFWKDGVAAGVTAAWSTVAAFIGLGG